MVERELSLVVHNSGEYQPCMKIFSAKLIIPRCRPEKDHAKQLNAFALLLKAHPELFISQQRVNDSPTKEKSSEWLDSNTNRESKNDENAGYDGVKLVLLGSARHREDLDRVQELRDLAARLEIEVSSYFLLDIGRPLGSKILTFVLM